MALYVADLAWPQAVTRPLRWLVPLALAAVILLSLVYLAAVPAVGFRVAFTLLLLLLFSGLALTRPVYAVTACMAFGPWIGLIRRVMNSTLGQAGTDPILVIVPWCLSLAFLTTCFTRRQALRQLFEQSSTARIALALIALFTAEIFNPLQGGPIIGLAGAMYRLIPLLVVLIVAAGETSHGPRLLKLVLVVAVIDQLYGLNQTFFGFPGYDKEFIDYSIRNGYRALGVGGVFRAFGTFVSSAEYTFYIDVAFGVAFTFTVVRWRQHRPGAALIGAALCLLSVVALLLESSRLSLLLMPAAMMFVLMAQLRSVRRGILLGVILVGAAFLVQRNLPTITGSGTVNQLLSHGLTTVSGDNVLADVSIQGHLSQIVEGFKSGITSPLGIGTGAGTQATKKIVGETTTTENDLTDMVLLGGFLAFGLYVTFLLRLLATSVRLYRQYRRPEHLAVGAAIVAGTSQILGSGYYIFGVTVLAVAGWLIREELRYARNRHRA